MMQNDAMYTCDMYIYTVYIFELLCTHLSRKPKQCISCTVSFVHCRTLRLLEVEGYHGS